MKILVTGTAGFIGYHLVQKLVKQEVKIVGIDNINTYYDINLKYCRLAECGIKKAEITDNQCVQSNKYNNYTFQKTDLTDKNSITTLFEKEQFDVVINLAAQAGVRYSLENPLTYIQSNIVGFLNILENCRQNNIKHLIYASSSSVYGMNKKVPFSEDDIADYPVSIYAATKRSDELMAYTYSYLYKLSSTGLRFFTVYGPWGRPDMAPMLFLNSILTDTPIKVFNNGDMMRDFTYIDDIIEGIINILSCIPDETEEHPFSRILNIGNSEPVQLMHFIHTMEKLLGKSARIEMQSMQTGDVKTTYADVSKLKALTGYSPHTNIDKGLWSFINWYKQHYRTKSICF